MASLLLNTNSVIMCPHGGIVSHVPGTSTAYRIEGRPPMLLSDLYMIQGCPFYADRPSPCVDVQWMTASNTMMVRGIPVLTQASVGICRSAAGVPQGPPIIASCQLMVPEPAEFTSVND